MAIKGYPKRYAQAIFEIANEQNELEIWQTYLKQISDLAADTDILRIFESPKLSLEDKFKIVDERLKQLNPMARNLAYLLISRNKMNIVGSIVEQYNNLVDNYRGVQHAVVTTAVSLSDDEKEQIKMALSASTGKTMKIESRVDPAIIGGMVVRIDGKLLEGSIRYKLLTLKNEMVGKGK